MNAVAAAPENSKDPVPLFSEAFAASSIRSRSVAVSRQAEPDKVEVIQNVALGALRGTTSNNKH